MNDTKIALVTGGLTGIGLAIAAELTRRNVTVVAGSRRGCDAETAAAALEAVGPSGMVAALDVASAASVEVFMATVTDSLGVPDILVNAAGISVHQEVDGHPDEDWDHVIDINLSGPFRMIRACLPGMKKKGWGRIVNIASTAARTAAATHGAYCASKAGLVGLTRAVALEGAPLGIACLAVSPGWVETDMLYRSAELMAARSGRSKEEEIAAMAASSPQNRLIQPEEIAALVAFCCSDDAPGLTMEDIQVNAGAIW